MPSHISFALTTPQFLDGTKTVTRRMGWKSLRKGDVLCAVEKAQGLRKGEKMKKLGMLRVIDVRREPLRWLTDRPRYGLEETAREGFPAPHDYHHPAAFVAFFCGSHKGCTPDSEVTRIEFERIVE